MKHFYDGYAGGEGKGHTLYLEPLKTQRYIGCPINVFQENPFRLKIINRLTWSVLNHSDSDSYFPEWSQESGYVSREVSP